MSKYIVTITEKLQLKVKVSARSIEEACEKIERKWKDADYVLNADNFQDVDFSAEPIQRELDYER